VELFIQQLTLLIEPQEFLAKLLLAPLEIAELLWMAARSCLRSSAVSSARAVQGKEKTLAVLRSSAGAATRKAAPAVSRPMGFCKPMRPHQAARCG